MATKLTKEKNPQGFAPSILKHMTEFHELVPTVNAALDLFKVDIYIWANTWGIQSRVFELRHIGHIYFEDAAEMKSCLKVFD